MKTAAIEEILHHRGHKGPNHETTAVKTWQRTISLTDYELNTEILLDADISVFSNAYKSLQLHMEHGYSKVSW